MRQGVCIRKIITLRVNVLMMCDTPVAVTLRK